ncbi:uncharacterized protein METZ01_LOCUS193645, partial [marine metagenome]
IFNQIPECVNPFLIWMKRKIKEILLRNP